MSKKIFWIASYPKSGNTLIRAILASLFFTKDGIFSFETLKKNEEKYGFDEAIKDHPFFNVGKSQQWKTQLNSTQKNLIENEFRDEMVKFKYL